MAANLDLFMVAALCLALLAGFPVAFTLGGVALLFGLLGEGLGIFAPDTFFAALVPRIFGIMQNEVLIAVPLFVFMGLTLERSKVAKELLEALARLFGSRRGGLAIAATLVGLLLAASTGIVGATVVTLGLLALPAMLRHGYDPRLATGTICAAGTLGQIVPPSIVIVLLGDVISAAYQTAQLDRGVFAPDPLSVGDLFAGALLPGLLLAGLYLAYLALVAKLAPARVPVPPPMAEAPTAEGPGRHAAPLARALLAPVLLIVAVLGSILAGIASPTEAAAIGAVGALLLAGLRLGRGAAWPLLGAGLCLAALLLLTAWVDLRLGRARISSAEAFAIAVAAGLTCAAFAGLAVAVVRVWRAGVLREAVQATARISAMIFAILIGATLFSLVFRGLGGDELVRAALSDLPGGLWGAVVPVMLLMFVLGFFLDFVEITFVVVPLVAPVLIGLGADPIWLGVLIAVNLQTSFLTPPLGVALFYLRGVAPASVATLDIYRGVTPFVGLQLLALALIAAWPPLATWLPGLLFGA